MFSPQCAPDEVGSLKEELQNQPWFFAHWRFDPTIQSSINMLEAIHEKFRCYPGLFKRLSHPTQASITFQVLPLEHFGLSDDLYIKMNARGKPLTALETFKARLEGELEALYPSETRRLGDAELSVTEFFERRFDTQWTDLFWNYRDKVHNIFDEEVMNLLCVVAIVSLDPSHKDFNTHVLVLRYPELKLTFSYFQQMGWINRRFCDHLIALLEIWSQGKNGLFCALPNNTWFDEMEFFNQAIRQPKKIDYVSLVKFASFVFYVFKHEGNWNDAAFRQWTRVVHNLVTNSNVERADDYGRCLEGLNKLLRGSEDILNFIATEEIGHIGGFSPFAIREEVVKAKLMTKNADWYNRIIGAESHGYFAGQIDFLLHFSGVLEHEAGHEIKNWDVGMHHQLQLEFDDYWRKAQMTFTDKGLKEYEVPHLWKRALLCVGDYLMPINSNYSFNTNAPSSATSWKRFLRGGGQNKRDFLKTLWDSLNLDDAIDRQLNEIIQRTVENPQSIEDWRLVTIRYPQIISYCGEQQIRCRDDAHEIYLLKKQQMNGAHAELFSYALYLELKIAINDKASTFFELCNYSDVNSTDIEPSIVLYYIRYDEETRFSIISTNGGFLIVVTSSGWETLADMKDLLLNVFNFLDENGALHLRLSRNEGLDNLLSVINCLEQLKID